MGYQRIFLGLSRAILLLLQLVQTLLFARLMAVDDLGVFLLFLTLSALFAKVGQAGFGITATYEISRKLVNSGDGAARQASISLMLALLFTAGVTGVLASFAGWIISNFVAGARVADAFAWGSALLVGHALTFALADFHRAFGRQGLGATMGYLVPGGIQTSAMTWAYVGNGNVSLEWMICLWIISFALPATLMCLHLLREAFPSTVKFAKSLVMITDNWRNATLIVLYHCAAYLDLWLVGLLMGESQAGIYGIAVAMALVLSIPSQINVQLLSPSLARGFTANLQNARAMMPLVRGSASIVFALTASGYVAIMSLGSSGYQSMLGSGMADGYQVFAVIGLGQVLQSLCGPGGAVMSMSGHQRECVAIVAIGTALGATLAVIMWLLFNAPVALAAGFAAGPLTYRVALTAWSARLTGLNPRPTINAAYIRTAWNAN